MEGIPGNKPCHVATETRGRILEPKPRVSAFVEYRALAAWKKNEKCVFPKRKKSTKKNNQVPESGTVVKCNIA